MLKQARGDFSFIDIDLCDRTQTLFKFIRDLENLPERADESSNRWQRISGCLLAATD